MCRSKHSTVSLLLSLHCSMQGGCNHWLLAAEKHQWACIASLLRLAVLLIVGIFKHVDTQQLPMLCQAVTRWHQTTQAHAMFARGPSWPTLAMVNHALRLGCNAA